MKKESEKIRQTHEMADWMFANPRANRKVTVEHFETLWDTFSKSTIKRRYYEAKEYNESRIQKQEKVRDNVLIKETERIAKLVILNREQVLSELKCDFKRLKEIKSGKVYKDVDPRTGQVIGFRQAGYHDEINAIRSRVSIAQQLAKMEGWEAPTKTDINIKKPISISVSDEKAKRALERLQEKLKYNADNNNF